MLGIALGDPGLDEPLPFSDLREPDNSRFPCRRPRRAHRRRDDHHLLTALLVGALDLDARNHAARIEGCGRVWAGRRRARDEPRTGERSAMNATGRPRAAVREDEGGPRRSRGRPLRQGERRGTTPQLPRSRRVEPRSPRAPACTPSTERAPALRAAARPLPPVQSSTGRDSLYWSEFALRA